MDNMSPDNPYAPPAAEVREVGSSADRIRVYSPTQVACGTIGGPVGLIYFLKANFAALGKHQQERRTVLIGAILMVALLVIIPSLPDSVPSLVFTVGYILTARFVTGRYQMTKKAIAESPTHEFQSNWRVFGIGLLCLVASVVLLLGPLLLLATLGIWTPT